MNENIDSHVPDGENMDSKINWKCKICKDVPYYAEQYLMLREYEKNKAKQEDDKNTDLKQIKYYYALLYLLDNIHSHPECSNSEHAISEFINQKCVTPERFDYYREIYSKYQAILISEKEIMNVNLKCDICNVLPYALFGDLDMVAKKMHSDIMEKRKKLELDKIIADIYLTLFGPCGQWKKCSDGVNRLELRNSVQTLTEYLETKDRKALHISLSNWNKVRANDKLLNTELKMSFRDFQVRHIPSSVLAGKNFVYLDFGVYQLYETNEAFRTRLDTYKELDKIQFVYSPTHMEEVCRMSNSVFESERRKNISEICGDHEVLPVQDGQLEIAMEPVDICFARAKKLQNLNTNAEESECASFEAMEEQTSRLLGWDEKEMEKLRKEISGLTSIQLFDPKNETIDNRSLNRIFCQICGSQIMLEKFRDYCKKERTFPEIREVIRSFYMLMNALGYHRNKIEKRTKFTHKAFYPTYDREFYRTIRSGFYDVDHLCYATKCNYFVTCDYTLSTQAMEIYRYLGCKTQVIYCEKKVTDPSVSLAVICRTNDDA